MKGVSDCHRVQEHLHNNLAKEEHQDVKSIILFKLKNLFNINDLDILIIS